MGDAVFSVQAIMTLRDLISGKLTAIAGKLAATGREAAALGTKLGTLAKAMLPVVAVAGLVLGSLVGAAMSTVKTQKALGELASVGVQDMSVMAAAATKFSNNFAGTTKSEFLSAAYDIKSGIASLSDAGVAAFTDLAALTGKATKSTVDVMTSLFATGYGIYKQSYDKLSDMQFGELFSAGIAASVQQFKTTGGGMASAISQMGASATNAKVPMQEQCAILGMLQSTMSGSEAGTKYRQFVSTAAKAGGDLKLNFLDANKQLRSMPEILGELHKKFGDTLDATEKLQIKKAFGSEEAVALIDLLYSKVSDLNANINVVGDAMGKGRGFTLAMAQTMNKDLGASIQIAGQRLHNLVEIIGGMFAPILKPVIDGVSAFVLVLQKGASWLASTGWGSAIIGVVAGLSALVAVSAAVAAGMWALSVAGPIAAAALAPLGAVLGALSAPIWIVIGLVAALVVAWKTNFGGMRDILSAWWGKVRLVVQGVKAVFGSLTGTTGKVSGQLAKALQGQGLVGAVTSLGKIVYRVQQCFVGMWDGIKQAFAVGWGMISPYVEVLVSGLSWLCSLLGDVTGAFGSAAAATGASRWQAVGRVVGVVVGAFAACYGILKLFQGVMILVRVATVAWTAAQWLLNIALNANPIGLIVLAVLALIAVAALVVAYWTPIKSFFAGLWRGIAAWASDAWHSITAGVAGVVAAISAGFEHVKTFLSGINLASAGRAIMHTLAAGITSAAGSVWSSVKGALGKVANLIPHSDAKEGPLSTLTAGGRAIMTTMATGVASAGPHLARATSAAMAGAALTLSGLGAPALPDLTATASWQAVSPPAVRLADATTDQALAGSRLGAPDGGKGGRIVIQSLTVTLPDVTDGKSFAQSLQRFVEQYDA